MWDSLQPYGLEPTRLLCPWDSPSKNTRVGCYALLQRIFLTQGSNPGLPHCRWILYHLSHQGSFCLPSRAFNLLGARTSQNCHHAAGTVFLEKNLSRGSSETKAFTKTPGPRASSHDPLPPESQKPIILAST